MDKPDTTNSSGISFGFSKKKEPSKLSKSIIKTEDDEKKDETEFVTSMTGNNLQGSEKTEKEKALVIPLIKENHWQGAGRSLEPKTHVRSVGKDRQAVGDSSTGDELTDQAIKELINDALNEGKESEKKTLAIPLLMKNRVPDGFETDDKLDVSLRPDEATEADYDKVPIDQYGLALLRGMGWSEESEKTIKPIEAVLRPKGLGLGADRSLSLQAKKNTSSENGTKDGEELKMTKGTYCVVERGKFKGEFGQIEGCDEDNARVFVFLMGSDSHVTISQYAVSLITKAQYKQQSKYINKAKYEEYQNKMHSTSESDRHQDYGQRDKEKRRRTGGDSDRDSEKRRQKDHDGGRKKKKHRHKHYDSTEDSDEERHKHYDSIKGREKGTDRHYDREERRHEGYDSDREKQRHKDHERARKKGKRRHKEYDSDEGMERDEHSHKYRHKGLDENLSDVKVRETNSSQSSNRPHKHDKNEENREEKKHKYDKKLTSRAQNESWLSPHLRVRVIDKNYMRGKFYKEKVVIEDVITANSCLCKTESGDILEGLRQSQLETVVPRHDTCYVMIVNGKHKSQIGQILKKNKEKCTAVVQLVQDRSVAVDLFYEDICEYTADISEEFDF